MRHVNNMPRYIPVFCEKVWGIVGGRSKLKSSIRSGTKIVSSGYSSLYYMEKFYDAKRGFSEAYVRCQRFLFSSNNSVLKNLGVLREMDRDDVFGHFSFVGCGDFDFWGKILCDLLNKDDEHNIPYGFVERIDAKANVNDMTLTLTYPLSKKDGAWKVKECNNPLSVLNLATMVLLSFYYLKIQIYIILFLLLLLSKKYVTILY